MAPTISRREAAALMLGTATTLAATALAATVLATSSRPAAAAVVLPAPTGKVILTVSGKIGATNSGATAKFDQAMLEAMPQRSFTTNTPWYAGPETFQGVAMADLMQKVGCFGTDLMAVALNDYSSEIPVGDFARYGVILALKRDGKYMPVRDKGPLFIIYPFDSNSDLKSQKFYSRSAWQVARLVIS